MRFIVESKQLFIKVQEQFGMTLAGFNYEIPRSYGLPEWPLKLLGICFILQEEI